MSNVTKMRKLYLTYPILQTLSAKLSWSHYVELLKIDDPLERSFYEKEAENAHWGVRELKRQMKSMLYHRLALSSDKTEVMRLSQEGQIIEKPEDVIKDPYIQAKQWAPDRSVDCPEIQKFAGALQGERASKGLFITTARFSDGAKKYAENLHGSNIVLIDGNALMGLMIKNNLGVSVEQVYEVKRIDSDFFSDSL